MESCKICGKQKQRDVRPPGDRLQGIDMATFGDDEEIARFLYQLTQDIINSKNFSDENISRLCAIHLTKSSYPDKKRLYDVINDFKYKLNVKTEPVLDSSHPEQAAVEQAPVEENLVENKNRSVQDKHVSAQSFINLPQLLVKERNSSISTITSYEFTSLEPSEPRHRSRTSDLSDRAKKVEPATMLQTIFLKQKPAKHRMLSSDSSTLALTKMVAANRR